MRLPYLILISILLAFQTSAQTDKDKLVGDWKYYLKDRTSFEFLRLNPDGTGLKCFGQTINGRDSLFLNHITTLFITNWNVENENLFLNSKNRVGFKINPDYKFGLDNQSNLMLQGEHLIFSLHPSHLNRNYFQRIVTYQKAEKIKAGYGVNTTSCIVEQRELFSFHPIDSFTKLAEYKGFEDLIPNLVACKHGYEYTQKYYDPPYRIIIPKSVPRWSFGFGNKNFYIRFDSGDNTETSVIIYYDFDDKMKEFYFSEIKSGKEKKNIVRQSNIDIYKTTNWEGKYEGKVFLSNSITVAYYTRDEKLEDMLQKCITSFKYK